MKLELTVEKTRVSDLTEGFQPLRQRVRYKWHPRFGYLPRIGIPTSKRADRRMRSLDDRLGSTDAAYFKGPCFKRHRWTCRWVLADPRIASRTPQAHTPRNPGILDEGKR